MIWLTWRQHRAVILVTVALLAVLGGALLWHGLVVADLAAGGRQSALGGQFEAAYAVLNWLVVAPALIGVFWGAPLVSREYERGTQLLAWTQSVTRARWLLVKLAGLAMVTALCGLALGGMMSAWLGVFDGVPAADRFTDPVMFSVTGVAVAGWWGFAFVLGVTAGAVLRRMLPAMAVTIAVFVLVMIGLFMSRGDYAEPERLAPGVAVPAGARVADSTWAGPEGELPVGVPPPPCRDAGRDTFLSCVREAGYTPVYYVHPADRYWRFQWTEAGLLALGAVVLGGVTVYRVVRRPA